MNNLFSVAGKVAIVTGGSSGIGTMIARGLLDNGARVYITARKLEQLQQAEAELSQSGECIAIQSDLSTMAGIESFVSEFTARESSLDILVNNAGASWGADIDDFPEAGWDKVMDLNVKSIFFLTQKLLPALRAEACEASLASVVNIASINGITHPGMNNYSYSASKSAVIQLTRHMAADLRSQFINVNGVAPGFFPSKMTKHMLEHEEAMAAEIPARRLGKPEDAAGTVMYLCSEAAGYLCGHTIVMDGGMVAQAG